MSGEFDPAQAGRITSDLAIYAAIEEGLGPDQAAGFSVLAGGWVQVFATIRTSLVPPQWKLGFTANKPAALAAVSLAEGLRTAHGRGERFGAKELRAFQALLNALIEKAPRVAAYVEPVPWTELST